VDWFVSHLEFYCEAILRRLDEQQFLPLWYRRRREERLELLDSRVDPLTKEQSFSVLLLRIQVYVYLFLFRAEFTVFYGLLLSSQKSPGEAVTKVLHARTDQRRALDQEFCDSRQSRCFSSVLNGEPGKKDQLLY
jgi:hypothetical protein